MSLVSDSHTVQKIYTCPDCGKTLPYCEGVYHAELEGDFALLLMLHGAGERGLDNEIQLRHVSARLYQYLTVKPQKLVAIYPQCPENKQWVDVPWSQKSYTMPEKPSESMALAMKLLDAKIAEYKIDPSRIYVTGISMGGFGTWDILTRRPDLFAAGMPVCGGADSVTAAPLLKDMPLWFFHGDRDGTVPNDLSRSMAAALQKAGSTKFHYTEFIFTDHNAWDPCYCNPDHFDWLFSQRKG